MARRRGPSLVRPIVECGAAPGFRAACFTTHRPGHQHRRNVADGAGHPLRGRHRYRAHLPVLHAHEGPAPARRAGEPGQRQPAFGPVRPRGRRHRHPPVLGGGLPLPSGVHRPGDPAHQPRVGDPADGQPRPRRRRGLPVRRRPRPQGHPRRRAASRRTRRPGQTGGRRRAVVKQDRIQRARPDPHRPRTGAHPRRPAAGAHAGRGPRQWRTQARDRGRRGTEPAGRARTPAGKAGAGRPGARPIQGHHQRLPVLPEAVGAPAGQAPRIVRQPVPQDVPARVPALHARARMAGPDPPAQPGRRRSGLELVGRGQRALPRFHPPVAAGRPAVADRRARGRGQGVHRHPQHQVPGAPGVGAVEEAAALGDGRGDRRDLPHLRPRRRTHRAGVGGKAGLAPAQAPVLRAALVHQARRGHGVPEVDALWCARRRRPRGAVPPRRSDRRPRDVHPPRARRRRVDHPPQVLRRQPREARGGRAAGGQGAPPRHRRRRRHAVRLLRRQDPAHRDHRRELRPVVEEDVAVGPAPARLRPARAGQPRFPRRRRRRLPRPVAAGHPGFPVVLPLRAGRRR